MGIKRLCVLTVLLCLFSVLISKAKTPRSCRTELCEDMEINMILILSLKEAKAAPKAAATNLCEEGKDQT